VSVGSGGRVHCLITQAELLKQKSAQFSDKLVKIEGVEIHYVASQSY
jgi:hypothetical protein